MVGTSMEKRRSKNVFFSPATWRNMDTIWGTLHRDQVPANFTHSKKGSLVWGFPKILERVRFRNCTPPKFNIAPETDKLPFQKETSLPTIQFQVLYYNILYILCGVVICTDTLKPLAFGLARTLKGLLLEGVNVHKPSGSQTRNLSSWNRMLINYSALQMSLSKVTTYIIIYIFFIYV